MSNIAEVFYLKNTILGLKQHDSNTMLMRADIVFFFQVKNLLCKFLLKIEIRNESYILRNSFMLLMSF